MTRPPRSLVRLAPLALALALVACDKRVDHSRAEDLVRSSLRGQGLELALVTCPQGVVAKPGTSFECTGKDDDGTVGTIDVKIEADETFSLRLRERYVDQEKFGAEMAKRLAKEQQRTVEVRCPKKAVIVKKGVRFSCDLREGSAQKRATFTYVDDAGQVDVKVD
jgi:hypothetical protein